MTKARELAELARTISDTSDATAITIDSSENTTFTGVVTANAGVLAQELVNVLPFAVNAPRNESDLSIDTDSEQKWLVDQAQMVPVLIKAIQELSSKVDEQAAKITALENN